MQNILIEKYAPKIFGEVGLAVQPGVRIDVFLIRREGGGGGGDGKVAMV